MKIHKIKADDWFYRVKEMPQKKAWTPETQTP